MRSGKIPLPWIFDRPRHQMWVILMDGTTHCSIFPINKASAIYEKVTGSSQYIPKLGGKRSTSPLHFCNMDKTAPQRAGLRA